MGRTANTRKLKLVCEKLTALSKLAGISVDLSPYVGNYGANAAAPRYIPSAVEIVKARSLFEDRPDWQWLYGVLAAYGLRPHNEYAGRMTRSKLSSVIQHCDAIAFTLSFRSKSTQLFDGLLCVSGEILWYFQPDPENPGLYRIEFFVGGQNH